MAVRPYQFEHGSCMTCSCENCESSAEDLYDVFLEVRVGCEALSQVLAPERYLTVMRNAHEHFDDVEHDSMLVLAIKRGVLERITRPIHRYILSRGLANINPAWPGRLIEPRWLEQGNEAERHRESRRYLGAIGELKVGEYLELEGAEILDMDAWDADAASDIVISLEGQTRCVEVKTVGTSDEDFDLVLRTIRTPSGEPPPVGNPSVPDTHDFLLLRAFEAAVQLQDCGYRVCAFLFIPSMGIRVELTANDPFWAGPRFMGTTWKQLRMPAGKTPETVEMELAGTIASLQEISYFEMDSDFLPHRVYEYRA